MHDLILAGGFLLAYWAWLFFAHLLGLSLVTYGMMDTAPRFTEIADLYFNNYWTVQGWAVLLFFLFCLGLSVGRQTHRPELVARNLKTQTLPLLLKTVLASTCWALLTLWVTPAQFLGAGFSVEEGLWAVSNCMLRSVAWLGWAVGEEWVFRRVLLERLQKVFPARLALAPLLLVTALWVLTRGWHQNLGLNQTLTLSLIGLGLGWHALRGGSYLQGATLLGGAAMTFQVLFSLPFLGHEFTGVWIIKYRSDDLLHLVSGGAGGPLSSAAVQLAIASWLVANSIGRSARRS